VIEALVHRAGLNAEILSGGELRPGDAVTAVD
jgi:MOSC domain-containing protein YiiM